MNYFFCFVLQNTMTSSERKLNAKLKVMQTELNDLTDQINSIPCLIIDGLQSIPLNADSNWKTHVWSILNSNSIYKSWVLDILNPTNRVHPNTIQIQFINNHIRNHAYKHLSQYVITNEFDAVISKENTNTTTTIVYD